MKKARIKKEEDIRIKLFLLFRIAQFCAIFGMVVGVLFFILAILKKI